MENKDINKMKLISILTLLFINGCATTNNPKLYDLLHRGESNMLAYKSVTAEDYKIEEYNEWKR